MQAIVALMFLAPDPVEGAAAAKDMALLDGAWVVAAVEHRGQKLPAPPLEKVVFASGKARDAAAGTKGARVYTYALDPKAPGVLFATEKGDAGAAKRVAGRYEVGDGTLRLCLTRVGTPPAGLRTGPEDDAILLDLRR